MNPNVATFREVFPQFADVATYSDLMLEARMAVAKGVVSESRWGDAYLYGVYLYTAHLIALAARYSPVGGRAVTGTAGVVASKSLGAAAITYDTSIGTTEGDGDLNLTPYGMEFSRLRRLYGVGAYQL